MITDVAGVFTVSNDGESFRLSERGEFGEEFVFAEIAAVGGVREIGGVIELVRLNDADGEVELLRNFEGIGEFAAREAGRIGDGGEGARAERLMRDVGEENGIDAA